VEKAMETKARILLKKIFGSLRGNKMKVPIAENRVSIQTPRKGGVLGNAPETPKVDPNAYGVGLGREIESAGNKVMNTGSDILTFAEKRAKDQDKDEADSMTVSATKEIQDVLYSNEMETVKDSNGIEREKPIGLMLQQRSDARGASGKYDAKAEEIILKHASSGRLKTKEAYDKFINDTRMRALTYRDNVIQHEVKQENEYSEDILTTYVDSELSNWQRMTPEQREASRSKIDEKIDYEKSRGVIDTTKQLQMRQHSRYNMFLGEFRADPLEAEKKLLAHGFGLDNEYEERARTKLKEIKTIMKDAENDQFAIGQDELFNGTLTFEKIDNLRLSPEKAQSLKTKYIATVGKSIKGPNYKSQRNAIDLIMSDSIEDRTVMYDAVLEAYDGNQTSDESKLLKKMADLKKDKKFASAFSSGKKKLEGWLGAKPKDIEGETKSLLSLAHKIVNEGKSTDEAFQDVVREDLHEQHPATALHPDVELTYSRKGGMKSVPKVKPAEKSSK
jgi:hypothetical protein